MNYIKNFLQSTYNYFFRPSYGFTQEELAIVERLTKEANDIAAGKYMTHSTLPEPIIPERRKSKRE